MKAAPVSKVWAFASDSSPGKVYQTLKRTDGSLSCDCPAWTKRVAKDGSRTCKHTRIVLLGQADCECIRSAELRPEDITTATKPAPVANVPRGGRVFDFSE